MEKQKIRQRNAAAAQIGRNGQLRIADGFQFRYEPMIQVIGRIRFFRFAFASCQRRIEPREPFPLPVRRRKQKVAFQNGDPPPLFRFPP